MVSMAVGCGGFRGWGVGSLVSRNQASPEAKCKFADFSCRQFLSFQFTEVVDYVKKHEVTLYLILCLSI